MSPHRLLRVGWVVFGADVAYWIWQMGHSDESGLPTWRAALNIATVIGGCILLAALLIGSYVGWRSNPRQS